MTFTVVYSVITLATTVGGKHRNPVKTGIGDTLPIPEIAINNIIKKRIHIKEYR